MQSVDRRSADDLQQRRLRAIELAGEELWLHASGSLIWPDRHMLVVSDLHLEKGSYLGGYANPIPPLDTRHTLERLHGLVERFTPRCVVCLGDTFHDPGAFERMTEADAALLRNLVGRVDQWVWILGNHDPAVPPALPGTALFELDCAPLLFLHQPDSREAAQVIGHYHPKTHCRLAGQTVRGRCFVQMYNRLYMPAFGAFAGGLDINDRSFPAGGGRKIFLLFNQRVWQT